MATTSIAVDLNRTLDPNHARLGSATVKRYHYDFDPTGRAPANLIRNERHTITPQNRTPQNVLIPGFAPFYRQSLIVTDMLSGLPLIEGVDYTVEWPVMSVDDGTEGYSPIYGGIQFVDNEITGQFELEYQTIGGQWALDGVAIAQALANQANDPVTTTFEEIIGVPLKLPPLEHVHSIEDFVGFDDVRDSIDGVRDALLLLAREDREAHPGYDTLVDAYFRVDDFIRALDTRVNNNRDDINAKLEQAKKALTTALDTTRNQLSDNITNNFNDLSTKLNNLKQSTIEGIRNLGNDFETKLNNYKTSNDAALEALRVVVRNNKTELTNKINDNDTKQTNNLNTVKTNLQQQITNNKQAADTEIANLKQRMTTAEGKPAYRITAAGDKLSYNNKNLLNSDDLVRINTDILEAKNADVIWGQDITNQPTDAMFNMAKLNYNVVSWKPDATQYAGYAIQANGLDMSKLPAEDRTRWVYEVDKDTGLHQFNRANYKKQGVAKPNYTTIMAAHGGTLLTDAGTHFIGQGNLNGQATSGSPFFVRYKDRENNDQFNLEGANKHFYPLIKGRWSNVAAGADTSTNTSTVTFGYQPNQSAVGEYGGVIRLQYIQNNHTDDWGGNDTHRSWNFNTKDGSFSLPNNYKLIKENSVVKLANNTKYIGVHDNGNLVYNSDTIATSRYIQQYNRSTSSTSGFMAVRPVSGLKNQEGTADIEGINYTFEGDSTHNVHKFYRNGFTKDNVSYPAYNLWLSPTTGNIASSGGVPFAGAGSWASQKSTTAPVMVSLENLKSPTISKKPQATNANKLGQYYPLIKGRYSKSSTDANLHKHTVSFGMEDNNSTTDAYGGTDAVIHIIDDSSTVNTPVSDNNRTFKFKPNGVFESSGAFKLTPNTTEGSVELSGFNAKLKINKNHELFINNKPIFNDNMRKFVTYTTGDAESGLHIVRTNESTPAKHFTQSLVGLSDGRWKFTTSNKWDVFVQPKAGTLALVSDVNDAKSNLQGQIDALRNNISTRLNGTYVTINTNETISGQKTFTQRALFNGHISIGGLNVDKSNVGGYNVVSFDRIAMNDFYMHSDRRIKEDISPIKNALNTVCELNGYTYRFKNSGKLSAGIIAQELQEVLPFLVAEGSDKNKTLSVNHISLIGYLIEAIKEEKQLRESLEERITKLEALLTKE